MASKIEALVRNFLRTDGDALYLVPGEKIFMLKGTSRQVVGREPLSEDSFRAVAGELAPGKALEALVEQKFRTQLKCDAQTPAVDILFGKSGQGPALMIRKAPEPEPDEAAYYATPAPIVDPSEQPSARPAPAPAPVEPPRPAARPQAEAPKPVKSVEPPPPPKTPKSSGTNTPAAVQTVQEIEYQPEASEATLARKKSTTTATRLPRSKSNRPVDEVLFRMLEAGASDVHLSSGSSPVFRLHGEMVIQSDLPALPSEEVEKLVTQILPDRHKKELAEHNDTDFAHEIEDAGRFRVNVFRDRNGLCAVFRQIPLEIQGAGELNLPPAVVLFGDLTKGLVLVTGPTGSGKSTTIAAILDYINETRNGHIVTIEDPIEFVHRNKKCLVNQREVGMHTGTFRNALRAALREDPDVVFVGEMRDLETISLALELAESGHLVFATLHTTTAASAIDRLVDQFPSDRQAQIRVMLAESLRGVVAQTLCKKVGGGRHAALEVLVTNNAVSGLIREGKTFQIPSVMTARSQGMQLLNDSLLDAVRRGLVEPREAYLKAVDKSGLLALFRSNNIPSPVEGEERQAPPGLVVGGPAPGAERVSMPASFAKT